MKTVDMIGKLYNYPTLKAMDRKGNLVENIDGAIVYSTSKTGIKLGVVTMNKQWVILKEVEDSTRN